MSSEEIGLQATEDYNRLFSEMMYLDRKCAVKDLAYRLGEYYGLAQSKEERAEMRDALAFGIASGIASGISASVPGNDPTKGSDLTFKGRAVSYYAEVLETMKSLITSAD